MKLFKQGEWQRVAKNDLILSLTPPIHITVLRFISCIPPKAIQHYILDRLSYLSSESNALISSVAKIKQPRALMAVITPKDVRGWTGDKRVEPGGGAPCPFEFTQGSKERMEGVGREKPNFVFGKDKEKVKAGKNVLRGVGGARSSVEINGYGGPCDGLRLSGVERLGTGGNWKNMVYGGGAF